VVRFAHTIYPYSLNRTPRIGLVQPQDKIVVRFAHTIYPYSLGGRRNIFHQDIHNIIKELAMMVKPTLVVLDATTAMMTNGPTGGSLSDLKPVNTMVVGTDQVAVDAFGATLLDKKISDLTFIAKAAALGLGTADWRSLRPEIVNAES